MKCLQCGLPLSPARSHCPRCGTIAGGSDKRASSDVLSPQEATFFQQSGLGVETAQQGMPEPFAQQLPFSESNNSLMYQQNEIFPNQQFGPQNQQWGQPVTPLPTFSPQPTPQTPAWMSTTPVSNQSAAYIAPFSPQKSNGRKHTGKYTRIGFSIAGLCVLAGGILLIFVYILSQSLSSSNTPTVQTNSLQNHSIVSTPSAVVTQTPAITATTAPSPTAVPTGSFPAQQYVINAQMASAANPTTGRPTMLETNFKVRQQTFLTWSLNPQGQSGAICLQWYINNQHQTDDNFEADVKPTSSYAYSYIYPKAAGPAYVEMYWATTSKCTDMQLAQRVNFTVS